MSRAASLAVVALGALLVGATFGALSLGPELLGLANPLYLAAWWALPFFWRIAKPEVFFLVSWLCATRLSSSR